MIARRVSVALAAPLALGAVAAACSGGGGSGGATVGVQQTVLAGRVAAGPVSGANVNVLVVDRASRSLRSLGVAATDANGRFTLILTGQGLFLFVATDGTFAEEATRQTHFLGSFVPSTLDDPRSSVLEAIASIDSSTPAGDVLEIGPLSTIASRRAIRLSRTDATALDSAPLLALHRALGLEMGIGSVTSEVDPRGIMGVDLASAGAVVRPATPESLLGALVGGISRAAANAGGDTLLWTDAVASDFQDGVLDGAEPGATAGTSQEIPFGFTVLPVRAATSDLSVATQQFLDDPTENATGVGSSSFAPLIAALATRDLVPAANVAPSFAPITNVAVVSTATAQAIAVTSVTAGTPAEDATQTVALTVGASDPTLFSTLSVTAPASGSATISFTPAGRVGTATITVTAKDSGGTANGGADTLVRTFTVTLN